MAPPARAIARVCRRIWPVKTDAELALRMGVSGRSARDILAGRAAPSFLSIVSLLHSEEGELFLDAMLGDATPEWRARLIRTRELAAVRAALETQRARIAELELAAAEAIRKPQRR
jgi:hypothetical protein